MEKIKNFLKKWTQLFKTNMWEMVFTVLLSFIIGALLFGGGNNPSNVSDAESDRTITSTDTTPLDKPESSSVTTDSTPDPAPITTNTLGDFSVEVLSWRLGKNWEGAQVIFVKYSFTNNSADTASFAWSIDDKLFQNGVELADEYIPDDSSYDSSLSVAEIQPGVTIELEKAYTLRDSTSPITVELSELISFSGNKITHIINLV